MTISRQYVSLRTYALAFAVALSPALLQDITCSPATGDATLSALEVEVMGENHISAFDSGQRTYDVWLPRSADTAIVRAYSTDLDSQVSYNLSTNNYAGTLDTIDYGYFPTGGGEVTLNGRSLLGIHVRAPGGARAVYTIAIQVGDLEYIVSPSGDDGNLGTYEAPLRTINRAAQIAQPGDTITVQSGVYREWVRPARGGSSEDTRITYRAAPGADVRIVGSEPATGWVQTSDNVWAIELDESRFAGFNPFNTLTRHPECVRTETGDCWGWLFYGRWTHLGDVYIDGVGLTEKQTMGEVEASPLSWNTETQDGATTIWANFGERDPNEAAVELNHRPFAFFPAQAGLSYITVKGFVIQNVATHWAPPAVFQPGAIGPNGGHHWVIEDNVVMYSKAVCISIGQPNGQADINASGYHVIRNNVIMRCGQSGVTGHLWTKNSQIIGNHIEEINYRHEFGGAQTAGIVHHVGSELHIGGNFIRSVTAGHGIWVDFQNNNWRVEGNVVLGAGVYAMMSEANQGPNLYANNIFVGGGIGVYSSRADAWVHNLFINAPQAWVNQDWGGRLPVADARWVNNMFTGDGLNSSLAPGDNRYNRNVFLDGAVPHPDDADAVIGNTPADIQVVETSQGVALSFQVDEATLSAGYPLVDNETLDLNFAIDATVDADFWGEQRSELSNSPGPFATLQPGLNEFTVYEYPPLYLKAQCFTGCDDSNDCTVDTCNPAVGCEHAAVDDGMLCGGASGTCQGGSCTAQFPCTEQGINDAIAAGGGTHTFDCATPTTVVTTAEVVIDNDVILDGEGKLTVDGGGDHRVLSVPAGVNAELIGFTMTGGSTAEAGGGILNAGTLTLVNSVVSGNTARFGGGIRNEGQGQANVIDTTVSNNFATQAAGGISNRLEAAIMTLSRSTVQGNTATGDVGGIGNSGTLTVNDTTVSGNEAGGEAGGIRNSGDLALANTIVSDNTAQLNGGGLSNFGSLELNNSDVIRNTSVNGFGGGIVSIEPPSTIVLNNTTVSGNSARDGGGGIGTSGLATLAGTTVSGNTSVETGGGIANAGYNGVLTLINSTVSGNAVTNAVGGGIGSSATMTVISTTVSQNTAVFGATGIWNGGSATLRNTIVDGDCQSSPAVVSLGGNVESQGNTCGLGHPTDQVFVPAPELNLQPLGNNGGPTMTHALLSGSAAIDQIAPADCVDADGVPLTEDQRGLPRPAAIQGREPKCDVGAFELQP